MYVFLFVQSIILNSEASKNSALSFRLIGYGMVLEGRILEYFFAEQLFLD